MEMRYVLLTEIVGSEDTSRVTYGIALVSVDDDVMSVLESVSDLSADKDRVEKFVAVCNRLALDPVHLREAAEDFAAEL